MKKMRISWRIILTALFLLVATVQGQAIAKPTLELVVLGSGGPVADNIRASSGYLVKVSGSPRILIDAGGGTFQRLGQAQLPASAIDVILLTHLHIDHTADLPAILKSAYFQKRGDRLISVFGPRGNKGFPSTREFMDGLIGPKGIYRYFKNFALKVVKTEVKINTVDLESDPKKPVIKTVWERDGIKITSIPVVHGPTPALAFRIDAGGECIAFSGDLNSSSGNLVKLAKDCDILVYDTAIPESMTGIAVKLHTKPSALSTAAAKANVKHLVLSHIMPPADKALWRINEIVRSNFEKKITVARDLLTIPAKSGNK